MDASMLRGLDFAGAGLAFALTTVALLLLQPVADRPVALGKALERPEDDVATVVHRVPAGLGEIVVAQILGRDMNGDQILRSAHSLHMRPPAGLFNPDGSSPQD